ncbi:MAG: OB-fold domain-containing protein [Deltaproteobacteria bacterium]|nr:OB-fold domain-containing protein [Deltaproteobacteria bacterium]MBW2362591.1 OB-fold domain-containing protein [Deltaproteobacteria bacterium]
MTTKRIPVIDGLFSDTADGTRLLGSRCASCNVPYFPKSSLCHNPDCTGSQMEDASFGPHGTVWSYSIQNYPPPPPARYDEPYKPYALGVVDLTDGLRVVGRMAVDDPESLKAGCKVELVSEPLCTEEDGTEVITWMFRPI